MLFDVKRRLFIAFNLPEQVKKEVVDVMASLREKVRGVRWVRPEGVHVTLHFLRWVEEERLSELKNILDETSKDVSSFALDTTSIGTFPTPTRPRVIFIALDSKGLRHAQELHRAIGRKLATAGFTVDERPWTPHITLGRVSEPLSLEAREYLGSMRVRQISCMVRSVELMESKLHSGGAEYSVIQSYPL